eukprot:scaffold22891_cov24-Prasinocladus_malaysianus.AAC.1
MQQFVLIDVSQHASEEFLFWHVRNGSGCNCVRLRQSPSIVHKMRHIDWCYLALSLQQILEVATRSTVHQMAA